MAKHNERRRNNRAIRRHAAQWAEQQGLDAVEVEGLKKANPKDVKEWLRDQGKNPDEFVDGVPQSAAAAPAVNPALDAGPAMIQQPAAPGGGGGAGGGGAGGGNPAGGGGAGRAAGGRANEGQAQRRGPSWAGESWCTPALERQIAEAQALQGGHRDERSLLNGRPETVIRLSRRGSRGKSPRAGTNETVRVELDNGATGYFKPFDGEDRSIATGFGQDSHQQAIHEVAAWRLASNMGPPWSDIVPPVVVREVNGRLGSFALERPGRPGQQDVMSTVGEWREAAFFDALIGQQDRHASNYLVAGDRITLIDHGYCFARPGDFRNWSKLTQKRAMHDPVLSYTERDALQRLVNSPDLMGLKWVLQPDRAAALHKRAQKMLDSGHVREDY